MKTIQVIDSADDCTFSLCQVTDDNFTVIYPRIGQHIEFADDLLGASPGMMQQMIESASRVVILADSSKFGRHAFVHICGLEDSTALVTNALPQPDLDQALREADVDIIVADS